MPEYSWLAGVQILGQKAGLTSAFLKTEAKATVPSAVGGAWVLASLGLNHQPRSRPGSHCRVAWVTAHQPGPPQGSGPEPSWPLEQELWVEHF